MALLLFFSVTEGNFLTGWRAYCVPDDEGEEIEGEILMFCPPCGEREFGPFDSGLRRG
jgi:hypothetical protein